MANTAESDSTEVKLTRNPN